jgi:hypothetical protein
MDTARSGKPAVSGLYWKSETGTGRSWCAFLGDALGSNQNKIILEAPNGGRAPWSLLFFKKI